MDKSISNIEGWDQNAAQGLEKLLQSTSSGFDGSQRASPFAALNTLAFNHGLLIIRTSTYREYVKLGATQDKLDHVLQQTFLTGSGILRLFIHDPFMVSHSSGCHTIHFVIVSHAATEVVRVSHTLPSAFVL